jgi:hypothetical protein
MSHTYSYSRTLSRAGGAVILIGAFSALALVGCPSKGIGDKCTPEDEFKEGFAGFTLESAFIESRSFQCQTRLCLVNHFQGRTSCPNGQQAPKNCNPDSGNTCDAGETCKPAGVILNDCDPTPCGGGVDPNNCNATGGKNKACGDRVCNRDGRFCECQSGDCPTGYYCDAKPKGSGLCTTRVCTVPKSSPKSSEHCYVPGTEIPIATAVCGQCDTNSNRDADHAVYCSCRCAPPADNASPADDNYNFCTCPDGFECTEINPNVGLGDPQLAGSYCIKQGTKYVKGQSEGACKVKGYFDSMNCNGQAQ